MATLAFHVSPTNPVSSSYSGDQLCCPIEIIRIFIPLYLNHHKKKVALRSTEYLISLYRYKLVHIQMLKA